MKETERSCQRSIRSGVVFLCADFGEPRRIEDRSSSKDLLCTKRSREGAVLKRGVEGVRSGLYQDPSWAIGNVLLCSRLIKHVLEQGVGLCTSRDVDNFIV